MHYTYILRSIPSPSQTYIGQTSNLKVRLAIHNSNQSPHTSKFSPWTLEFYSAFKNKENAIAFEKYLKSGSGKVFVNKYFLSFS